MIRQAERGEAPTIEQWGRALDLARELRRVGPWQWIPDGLLTGFRMPDDETPYFVTPMGYEGIAYGLMLFRGLPGLARAVSVFFAEEDPVERFGSSLIEVPQLRLEFKDRSELKDEDRMIIRAAGRRFRGKGAWPRFRSSPPALLPVLPDADELDILCTGIEHLLAITPRFRGLDPDDLEQMAENLCVHSQVLMRIGVRNAQGEVEWIEGVREMDAIEQVIVPEVSPSALRDVQKLRAHRGKRGGGGRLMVDLRPLPVPVAEESGAREWFPYLLVVADSRNGVILHFDMLSPLPDLESMAREAAESFAGFLGKELQERPQCVLVPTPAIGALVDDVCRAAAIPVIEDDLPGLDNMWEDMEKTLARAMMQGALDADGLFLDDPDDGAFPDDLWDAADGDGQE